MRFSNAILASTLSVLASQASADCSYEGGNYYCNAVSAVRYTNVGYSGSYQDVTNMDESTCECTQQSKSFSGSNAPLNEEVSVHFRGPVKLLQFAAYYPASNKAKRDAVPCAEDKKKHVHHQHKREPATEVVQLTQTVYVNGQGNVVSPSTSATSTKPTTTTLVGQDNVIASSQKTSSTLASSKSVATSATTSTSSSTSASASATGGSGSDWSRFSYFTPGSTDNCVFLNTKGGSESGVWSSCFGNSLSYAAANGVDAASSATPLGEVLLKSDEEYVIFSGETCSSSSSSGTECGYTREGIPAYHGFGGSEKILVFEFEMPNETSASGSNPDMPAIWLLNAKIARTLQYGKASCSCWSTGCGELDLFEILSDGDDRLISHLHSGQGNDGTQNGGGGSQDYFNRPTSGSFIGAVVFNSDKTIQIAQLDSFDFSSGLSSSQVSAWMSISGATAQIA